MGRFGTLHLPLLALLQVFPLLTFGHSGMTSAERADLVRCRWALRRLTHIDSDTKKFKLSKIDTDILSASASSIDPLEMRAAVHLRKFLSIPILLAPDIGKHKSTPGFDGVLYDHYGRAYSNLSIKSIDVSKLTHGHITQTMRSARASARTQLLNVYNLDQFLHQRGFIITDDGSIVPRKGLAYQVRSAAHMQYFIDLFGLNLEEPRKTSVLINVFNSNPRPGAFKPRFILKKHHNGKWRPSSHDDYLFINNLSGRNNNFGANLSHLAENLKYDPRISEYIFLSPNQIIVIRPGEILHKELSP
jgi:hypothetical protein